MKFDTRPVAERGKPRKSKSAASSSSEAKAATSSDAPSETPSAEVVDASVPATSTGATALPQTATDERPVSPRWYRDRMRRVEVGQTLAEVHDRLGDAPVRGARRNDPPIPAPRYVVEFARDDGVPVRLESWVVRVHRRDGCPDFTFDDVPITYVDGVVWGLDWESVEWEWEKWGGDLAVLRAAQDRFTCLDPDWESEDED